MGIKIGEFSPETKTRPVNPTERIIGFGHKEKPETAKRKENLSEDEKKNENAEVYGKEGNLSGKAAKENDIDIKI